VDVAVDVVATHEEPVATVATVRVRKVLSLPSLIRTSFR
jgi:hypothetical protein